MSGATIKSSRELFDVLAVITEGHPGKLRLAALDELRAVLRRDWDRDVLEASLKNWTVRQHYVGDRAFVALIAARDGGFFGPTRDAARHAAAQAIYPTLSAEEQARIGACP